MPCALLDALLFRGALSLLIASFLLGLDARLLSNVLLLLDVLLLLLLSVLLLLDVLLLLLLSVLLLLDVLLLLLLSVLLLLDVLLLLLLSVLWLPWLWLGMLLLLRLSMLLLLRLSMLLFVPTLLRMLYTGAAIPRSKERMAVLVIPITFIGTTSVAAAYDVSTASFQWSH